MDIGNGDYFDGSWEITVLINDLQMTRRVRVRGDTHVGGLMLKLVELIDMKMDWSDHALWWPERNCWLMKTRHSLDQVGVQADTHLEFQRMHDFIRIQLPDLQEHEMKVSFAKTVFSVTIGICKELCIRHPEELSLKRCDLFHRNHSNSNANRSSNSENGNGVGNHSSSSGNLSLSGGSTLFRSLRRSKPKTPVSSPSPSRRRDDAFNPLVPKTPGSPAASPSYNNNNYNSYTMNGFSTIASSSPAHALQSPNSINSLAFEGADRSCLANSPPVSIDQAQTERGLIKLKGFNERALVNEAWLDSSKSLMQQGIRPDSEVQLRYKYHAYYDLNPKYDCIRINQIYEQARWSILSEEVDCTEEEMLAMAALQMQIRLLSEEERFTDFPDSFGQLADKSLSRSRVGNDSNLSAIDEEIDAALLELEQSLLSDSGASQERDQLQRIPELTGYLKVFKPKRFTLKQYKKYFCRLKETTLHIGDTEATESLSLKGAEVATDVSVSTQRFCIRLLVLAASGSMHELWLKCETKEQYAEWTAALRLASRGKTLASKSQFDAEVKDTLNHLDLQSPKLTKVSISAAPNMDASEFVSAKVMRKHRGQQVLLRILERHAHVKDKSLIDAKLEYIRMWQRLPNHGVAYFLVRYSESSGKPLTLNEFRKEKQLKNELIGVSFNKISRLNPNTGDAISTWHYHELDSWTVNWEVLDVTISLNRPPHKIVLSPAPTAVTKQVLCKTLIEFIGGYVFLNLRNPEKSQDLNEQMFHKLTGCKEAV